MIPRPLAVPRFRTALALGDLAAGGRALLGSRDPARGVAGLEATFAESVGRAHAVAAPSARGALVAVVRALGLGEGDEVLFPAYGYFAMPAAVKAAGFRVAYADVGRDGFLLDPGALGAALRPRTRVVVPTHLYGSVCDLGRIAEAAERAGAVVVEDGTQALGAAWRGRPVGSFGAASLFTLGVTKHVTFLSGAMVAVDDGSFAREVRRALGPLSPAGNTASARGLAAGLAFWAATRPGPFTFGVWPALLAGDCLGVDLLERLFGEDPAPTGGAPQPTGAPRLVPGPVEAAVGLAQLRRLSETARVRRVLGRSLASRLRHRTELIVPPDAPGSEPVYSSFAVRVRGPGPDALARRLRRLGVDCARGFMQDCSTAIPADGEGVDPSTSGEPPGESAAPHAASAVREVLHLPLYPGLDDADIDRIAAAVERAL